ncbi:MAG TPA: DUF1223 domain-containing protein [Dongiaceae bacterium]|nr:DUF1223 domain-containing protein [Dongiaceae bacterium]
MARQTQEPPKISARRIAAAGLPLLAAILALIALQNPALASGTRPVVVELFTSQGCSSCPPADALLGELARRPDVIALGFHVDYWDNLGWKDPLSAPGSTQRQRDYAQLFNLASIYTPQMVIEGRLQVVGSDRDAVLGGIADAAPETTATVSFDSDRHAVTIGGGTGSGKVLLVRFQRQRNTDVAQGENAGTRARDANGVTALTELGAWYGTELHFTIAPPAGNEGIAVLVQAPDGHMLGAGVAL